MLNRLFDVDTLLSLEIITCQPLFIYSVVNKWCFPIINSIGSTKEINENKFGAIIGFSNKWIHFETQLNLIKSKLETILKVQYQELNITFSVCTVKHETAFSPPRSMAASALHSIINSKPIKIYFQGVFARKKNQSAYYGFI